MRKRGEPGADCIRAGPLTNTGAGGGPLMLWAFRILATLNGLLLALAFLYQSPGEDPAGAGLRLGFAVIYAVLLAAVLLVYRFVSTP